jgi:hypothetical protein
MLFNRNNAHIVHITCGAHDSPKLRVDDRRDISGIVHPLKSSGSWIDAPDIYSPGKTL